jgi:hypothetical protein
LLVNRLAITNPATFFASTCISFELQPRDVDDLWIKGGGNEDFSAVVVGVGYGDDRRVVCETVYATASDLYAIQCELAEYEAGNNGLYVLLDDTRSVGESPVPLTVDCPAGFVELDDFCQCDAGSFLDRGAAECAVCPVGKWSERIMSAGEAACRRCNDYIPGSITLVPGAATVHSCVCSPAFFKGWAGSRSSLENRTWNDDNPEPMAEVRSAIC